MNYAINEFTGRDRFLSNFYPAPVEMGGYVYPSVEHAYQAAKTSDESEQQKIRLAFSASQAKRIGRKVAMRIDWDRVCQAVMLDLLRKKFATPELKTMLLKTGDLELVEGNYWNDTYWGVCKGVGHNHLGRLLMQVRQELRDERPA